MKAWYEENKYNNLFISIVLLILAPPFLYERAILGYLIYVLVTLVLVNCLIILFGQRPKKRLGIIIGILVLGFVWMNFLYENLVFQLISNAILAILFGMTFRKVVIEIFKLERVSTQVIVGAIAAYLILGLMGAFVFDVVDILYPNSFSTAGIYSGFYSEIYLSFVTISTLGYGDITPVTPQGQATAIFISLTGQLYLAILMAMLVGKFLKDST